MSASFDAHWLMLREGLDGACRNIDLARRLSQRLPGRPHLLDLGAGTGSLFRWMAPIIGRAQTWTLVDADTTLLTEAKEMSAEWAASLGYAVTLPVRAGQRALVVHAKSGAWRIETVRADLARAPLGRPLAPPDAVVCSALLDLVSSAWLERFTATLRTPLLAFLIVDGRLTFWPRDPFDRLVLAAFRRDQQRDKGLGRALGPHAPSVLNRLLRARGFEVTSVTSDWRIPPTDPAMLNEIVASHADVAARWLPRRRQAIALWQETRLRQARAGRLAIMVGHRDILALPS